MPSTSRLALAVLCLTLALLAGQASASPESAARGVLTRLLGDGARQFTLQAIPAEQGRDVLEVSARGGVVTVRGSSGVALCRGAYEYLKRHGLGMVSWEGSSVRLPARLPDMAPLRVVTPYRYRHYFNVCTSGYTMTWWDWSRWRREIDWMALHGVNMPLAMNGQEGIWQRVWHSMGLTDADLKPFFSGPAFLPWHRMGNLNGHAGPLPQHWLDSQVALQKQILAAERDLGMTSVVPAFSGFVPPAFKKRFPEARVRNSSGWCGFEPTLLLDPNDPQFLRIGGEFVRQYTREFGTDHLYLADVFNEMRPQVQPETKLQELADMGEAVYRSILAGDPQGTWVMQGWLFLNDPGFWQKPEAEALLSRIPDDRMVILDLGCDIMQVWRAHESVRRKQWIYCVLHNFGQTTSLGGYLPFMATDPPAMLADPDHGQMAGMGMTPEGIGQNPAVYELLTDMMWRSDPVRLKSWWPAYLQRRYGTLPPAARQAWATLASILYENGAPSPGYNHRPDLGGGRDPSLNTRRLQEALEQLLSCAGRLGAQDLYRRDVVDVMKRWLADCAACILARVRDAAAAGDAAAVRRLSAEYLAVLADLDALLSTRPEHRLDAWIRAARKCAAGPAEADLYERNARMQVTVWGGPVLYDYAWKEWGGLVGDFYARRWAIYLGLLQHSLEQGKPFDGGAARDAVARWEWQWAGQVGYRQAPPSGDTLTVARVLFAKHRDWIARYGPEVGIAVGKPVTASDWQFDKVPSRAVDGDASDRDNSSWWAPEPPAWLQVDLEEPETLDRVQVVTYWDGERSYQYRLEGSTDGVTWTCLADMSQNTQAATPAGVMHRFAPQPVRYLRVTMLHNTANPGQHIVELRVFAPEPSPR